MSDSETPVITWERVSAGVYTTVGGRFKISRRGPKKWVLIDKFTGKEMRFDFLRDAQCRAAWVLARGDIKKTGA